MPAPCSKAETPGMRWAALRTACLILNRTYSAGLGLSFKPLKITANPADTKGVAMEVPLLRVHCPPLYPFYVFTYHSSAETDEVRLDSA